jgi:hypothetical protein
MLKEWRTALFFALAACFAIWIQWWASWDFPLSHQICGEGQAPNDCSSYNVIFYSAWRLAIAADHWGILITAFATVAIGYFTFTLKKSTDKLWEAGERQLDHAKDEAFSGALRNLREEARLGEQIEILRQSAEASAEHARIAGAALTQLERPYVFIFGVRVIKRDAQSRDFFVEYTVANYGKMPAIIEAPHIGFDISERAEPPIPPLLYDGHNLMASPILEAGEQRKKIRAYFPSGMVGPDIIARIETISAADVEPNASLYGHHSPPTEEPPEVVVPTFTIPEGFDIFFRAVIRYRGPFTAGHETGAVWLYNPGMFEFAVRGGEEHNYIR